MLVILRGRRAEQRKASRIVACSRPDQRACSMGVRRFPHVCSCSDHAIFMPTRVTTDKSALFDANCFNTVCHLLADRDERGVEPHLSGCQGRATPWKVVGHNYRQKV